MIQMDVLHIALIVLVTAGIWAVVELAITFRKTRSTVDDLGKQVSELTTNVNDVIEQTEPVIQKLDGIVTDLEPAAKQALPLMEKANTALDVVTVDLASVNDILVDVSSVTDTASNVTSTVSKAANSAVSGVAGVVGKFTGGGKSDGRKRHKLAEKSSHSNKEDVAEPAEAVKAEEPVAEERATQRSYFTYGSSHEGE